MVDNQKSQPTILVKKADGTTERITLQEFKKRRQTTDDRLRTNTQNRQEVVDNKNTVKNSSPLSVDRSPKVRRVIPLLEEEEVVQPIVQVPKPVAQQAPRRVIPLVEEGGQTINNEQLTINPSTRVHSLRAGNQERVEKKREQVLPTTPVVQTETHIANTTPVTKVFESPHTLASAGRQPATSKQKVDDDSVKGGSVLDGRSLLDEDDSEIKAIGEKKGQAISHTPAASVSFQSSVPVPKDLKARTEALILSWKKGIRDQYQFIDYAMRPASEGGLGLTKVDAVKLFEEISQSATLLPPRPPSRPASVPSVAPRSSSLSTPSQKKPQLNHIPNSSTLIREIAPTSDATTVMGPVEEAASLSIQDFRRLSRVPKTAGEMVVAKFSGWKDESYLLYLQVRDSWRNSPLFRLYIEKTTEAIGKNLTITAVLQSGELTYEEYLAIAEVNRKLGQMD